jgi:GntR family transcriptional regulator
MRIDVDPKAPTPPSEQIADQMRFAVASGRLKPGDRLPSVRGLAESSRVNPNTVARTYRELEREGTVETRPGSGCFVAAGGLRACRALRDRIVGDRIARAVREACDAGLSELEIEAFVAATLREVEQEQTV